MGHSDLGSQVEVLEIQNIELGIFYMQTRESTVESQPFLWEFNGTNLFAFNPLTILGTEVCFLCPSSSPGQGIFFGTGNHWRSITTELNFFLELGLDWKISASRFVGGSKSHSLSWPGWRRRTSVCVTVRDTKQPIWQISQEEWSLTGAASWGLNELSQFHAPGMWTHGSLPWEVFAFWSSRDAVKVPRSIGHISGCN